MVEIENKHAIYEKKFGYVNWLGFFTLYQKEILRFLKVVVQTIISPLVTSLLFLMVLSLAIGNERGGALNSWRILNGIDSMGCTIHHLDEGIDTGAIVLQKETKRVVSVFYPTKKIEMERQENTVLEHS